MAKIQEMFFKKKGGSLKATKKQLVIGRGRIYSLGYERVLSMDEMIKVASRNILF